MPTVRQPFQFSLRRLMGAMAFTSLAVCLFVAAGRHANRPVAVAGHPELMSTQWDSTGHPERCLIVYLGLEIAKWTAVGAAVGVLFGRDRRSAAIAAIAASVICLLLLVALVVALGDGDFASFLRELWQ